MLPSLPWSSNYLKRHTSPEQTPNNVSLRRLLSLFICHHLNQLQIYRPCLMSKSICIKYFWYRNFLDGPVVKTSPSRVRGVSFIPDPGAKIPQTSWSKNQSIKQKQYCNKFNKDFLKCPPQKKILKNEKIFLVYILKEIVPNKTAPWSASLVRICSDSLSLSV